MNWGKAGREYWQNELQNMIGVKSGNTAPWELPEFKAMAGSYNSQANNNLNNIISPYLNRMSIYNCCTIYRWGKYGCYCTYGGSSRWNYWFGRFS